MHLQRPLLPIAAELLEQVVVLVLLQVSTLGSARKTKQYKTNHEKAISEVNFITRLLQITLGRFKETNAQSNTNN